MVLRASRDERDGADSFPGYANGIIGSVNTLLRHIYGTETFPQNYSTTLNSVVFVGTILGMLTFGEALACTMDDSQSIARMDLG